LRLSRVIKVKIRGQILNRRFRVFKHKVIYSLLVALALAVILPLSACRPGGDASGAPMPPTDGASDGGAHVDSVELVMLESFPVQVRAVIRGQLADGCTEIRGTRVDYDEASKTFQVAIETHRDSDQMCTQALVPFEESVSLDAHGLSAGEYTVEVQDQSASFELAVDNVLPDDNE
jgi:inhibitor of cysteine peptidase